MTVEVIESVRHALVIISLLCHCFLSVGRTDLPFPAYLAVFVMDVCLITSMVLDYFVPGECSRYYWHIYIDIYIRISSKHQARCVLLYPFTHAASSVLLTPPSISTASPFKNKKDTRFFFQSPGFFMSVLSYIPMPQQSPTLVDWSSILWREGHFKLYRFFFGTSNFLSRWAWNQPLSQVHSLSRGVVQGVLITKLINPYYNNRVGPTSLFYKLGAC